MAKNKKYILVRYGKLHDLGLFECTDISIPKTPTRVIVKNQRGLEMGEVVGNLATNEYGHFKLPESQIKRYYENSQINMDLKPIGQIIRIATAEDISEEKHLLKFVAEEAAFCKSLVHEMNLPMKIVDVDHIFGGERIIFYFMSETRVDFRELVKTLAHEYQSRIEMHQIGSRDEAKLLGDIESCGQECCCIRFLKELKPVNMRMAKMQKATLDPSKISGYCGRLKCCLRYEDKTYMELKKRLPHRGTIVKTSKGEGKVTNTQILTQLLIVSYDNGTREAVPLDEVEIIPGKKSGKVKGTEKTNKEKTQNTQKRGGNDRKNGGAEPEKNGCDGGEECPNRQKNDEKSGEKQ